MPVRSVTVRTRRCGESLQRSSTKHTWGDCVEKVGAEKVCNLTRKVVQWLLFCPVRQCSGVAIATLPGVFATARSSCEAPRSAVRRHQPPSDSARQASKQGSRITPLLVVASLFRANQHGPLHADLDSSSKTISRPRRPSANLLRISFSTSLLSGIYAGPNTRTLLGCSQCVSSPVLATISPQTDDFRIYHRAPLNVAS